MNKLLKKTILPLTFFTLFSTSLFAEDEGVLFEFQQNKGDAVVHVAVV